MKHFMKKSISMIMVMMMILAMTMVPAFATGANLNQLDRAQYTTFLDTFKTSVTLYATTTNTFADNIPFTTSAEADSVTWGWTEDGSTIVSYGSSPNGGDMKIDSWGNIPIDELPGTIEPYEEPTPDEGYYAFVTVVLDDLDADPGVYSIVGKMSGSFDINFTLGVQNDTLQDPIEDIDIRVFNATNNTTIFTTQHDIDPVADLGGVLEDKDAVLQNDPCVMGTLQVMEYNADIDSFTLDVTFSYAGTLTISSVPYPPTGAPTYYGWSYGVYRDNGLGQWELVPLSQVVSASAFPLEAGDRVMWVYGSYGSVPGTW